MYPCIFNEQYVFIPVFLTEMSSCINSYSLHAVPAVSLNFDQLTVIEVEGVVSVCATISSVPAGGLNCPITLSLSATGTGDKPGIIKLFCGAYYIYRL